MNILDPNTPVAVQWPAPLIIETNYSNNINEERETLYHPMLQLPYSYYWEPAAPIYTYCIMAGGRGGRYATRRGPRRL